MEGEKVLIEKLVRLALAEDRVEKDVTTNSLLAFDRRVRAEVRAKGAGVISGSEVFAAVFHVIDPDVHCEVLKRDGTPVQPGQVVIELQGRESSILKGERTALNFLQRLSGIATLTARYVAKLRPYRAVLLDTRKTTPGLRFLEKKAVRDGGGSNHRFDLEEMAMVKDNHILMAGGITPAVREIRQKFPNKRIEVEVKNLRELRETLDLGVERIMLDNFSTGLLRKAVQIAAGQTQLESSGNVTLRNIARRAASGVDFISVGALTHSFQSLDLSLEIRS